MLPLRLAGTMLIGMQVRKTMKNIKWVLVERWYAWEDARKLAREDETIQIKDEGGLRGQLNREVVYESSEHDDEQQEDVRTDRSTPSREAIIESRAQAS
jgi:large subunit ribosomal protein L47